MKIQLFNPSVCWYSGVNYRMNPCLSLSILAQVLEDAGHKCSVIDLEAKRVTPERLKESFATQQSRWPDWIGFTALSASARGCKACVDAVRAAGYNRGIVVGGVYASLFPEEVAEWDVDLIVTGECEGNIISLLESDANGVWQGEPAPIEDIPTPAWHRHSPHITEYYGNQPVLVKPEGVTMWTRGCPHRCVGEDTRITLLSGDTKAVQNVKIGDELRGINPYTGLLFGVQVKAKHHETSVGSITILITDDGESLYCTPDHEVLRVRDDRSSEFVKASEVVQGDLVITYSEKGVRIPKNATRARCVRQSFSYQMSTPTTLYDLETWPYHNYFANSILVHNCTFCVTGDTLITTMDGIVPITDLGTFDSVLTSQGFSQVKDKQIINFSGDLVRLNVTGSSHDLRLTPDHQLPIVPYSAINRGSPGENCLKRSEWLTEVRPTFTRADAVRQRDFVVVPYPTQEVAPGIWTEDLCELAGYYISEGNYTKRRRPGPGRPTYHSLTFTFGAHEEHLVSRVLELAMKCWNKKGSAYINHTNNAIQVTIYTNEWALRFRENFGAGAKNKRIPGNLLLAPHSLQESLIRSMFYGDGHNGRKGPVYTTVSRTLADQLRIILLRLGYLPLVFLRKKEKAKQTIQGRKVNVSDAYVIRVLGQSGVNLCKILGWKNRNPGANRRFNTCYNLPERGFALYPVRAISREPFSGLVYDITTNGTFVASGVAISNCSNPIYSRQRIRYRPPINIYNELVYLKEKGIRGLFRYDDESFGSWIPEGWFEEVRRLIEPLGMVWKAQGRCSVKHISVELMEEAYAAGCRTIMWGVESFSQKVLDAMKKDCTVEDIWHTLKCAKEAGIKNWVFTMIGSYGETEDDLKLTATGLRRGYQEGLIDFRQTTVVTTLPGTELWDIQQREGWLVDAPDTGPQMNQVYRDTPWLTRKQIQKWIRTYQRVCPARV